MAKVHICDACRSIVDNPYGDNMRTLYVKVYKYDYRDNKERKKWRKFHFCKDCYSKMTEYLTGNIYRLKEK